MFLGVQCAQLLANWIYCREVEVAQLILSQNQLGDEGIEIIAKAVCHSGQIFLLELAQNGLSNKCAVAIFEMLRFNESIVHIDLGSSIGAHPNRFGFEFSQKLAVVFETGYSLI